MFERSINLLKNLFCDISLPCRYDKAGKIFVVIIIK